MSVKIKINWNNENVVSESVQIYRSDSLITTPTQAMLIAILVGDVYEYDDLDVVSGQQCYYMLSTKLAEREVFTECFKVSTLTDLILSIVNKSMSYASTATGSISSLTIPAHNAGDVVLLFIERWGSDSSAANVPSGYTAIDATGDTYRYVSIGYRIANSTSADSILSLSCISASALILRGEQAISELAFVKHKTKATSPALMPTVSAIKKSLCLSVGVWSSSNSAYMQSATISNSNIEIAPQLASGLSSLKHVVASKNLNEGISSGVGSVSITNPGSTPYEIGLMTLLISAK